jgi:hypothetical protein
MSNHNSGLQAHDIIPQEEIVEFDKMIKEYRSKHIRNSKEMVEVVFADNSDLKRMLLEDRMASKAIKQARELVWSEYQKEEYDFNTLIIKDISKKLKTPDNIINQLIEQKIMVDVDDLIERVKDVCGEYAGRISPYIYKLSLSTTQSRRSRAGSTFEAIIYTIYDYLGYPYDSQAKVGRKVFQEAGLGKKVDSILPGIDEFARLRSKTIIGTMKTTLRERWQEVAEEIERTKIPEIHLLTADEKIAANKAKEMAAHNIRLVAYDSVANCEELRDMKNIISFEEYLFKEIPHILSEWSYDV